MELRLYLDEDSMDQRLVRALRARGLDVETAPGAKRPERMRRSARDLEHNDENRDAVAA